ncbi:MAG: DegT/DnrJ/EryC1/StrS family aminotransferase [Archangium sp.]
MKQIPLLDLKAQYAAISNDVQVAIARVVESQHFINGPEVDAFEAEVAKYCGMKHAIGCSSGTDAILMALMALGIGPGDEVLTSPQTFVATAMSIARVGAVAKFVDVEPDTQNIDPELLEKAITPKTRAIMPVHLFGQMADMTAIARIAAKHNLPVIEDGAQAVGSEWQGQRMGSMGTVGCLSFFPSKNLGAFGDAGGLVTNDSALAAKLKLIRAQGQDPKYFSKIIGGNFRIDALQAAILRAKLPHLDGWTTRRQHNADRYRRLFAEAGVKSTARPNAENPLTLPVARPGTRHVYNQFVVRSIRRDALKDHLKANGVGTEVYYPQPMHLQACFASWGGAVGQFPEAEAAANESLALPVYPELTDADAQRVVELVMAAHAK